MEDVLVINAIAARLPSRDQATETRKGAEGNRRDKLPAYKLPDSSGPTGQVF
jgi:hypothetical protein